MKRIIALLLCLIMAVCAVACGDGNAPAETTKAPETQAPATDAPETQAPATDAPVETTEAPAPETTAAPETTECRSHRVRRPLRSTAGSYQGCYARISSRLLHL